MLVHSSLQCPGCDPHAPYYAHQRRGGAQGITLLSGEPLRVRPYLVFDNPTSCPGSVRSWRIGLIAHQYASKMYDQLRTSIKWGGCVEILENVYRPTFATSAGPNSTERRHTPTSAIPVRSATTSSSKALIRYSKYSLSVSKGVRLLPYWFTRYKCSDFLCNLLQDMDDDFDLWEPLDSDEEDDIIIGAINIEDI